MYQEKAARAKELQLDDSSMEQSTMDQSTMAVDIDMEGGTKEIQCLLSPEAVEKACILTLGMISQCIETSTESETESPILTHAMQSTLTALSPLLTLVQSLSKSNAAVGGSLYRSILSSVTYRYASTHGVSSVDGSLSQEAADAPLDTIAVYTACFCALTHLDPSHVHFCVCDSSHPVYEGFRDIAGAKGTIGTIGTRGTGGTAGVSTLVPGDGEAQTATDVLIRMVNEIPSMAPSLSLRLTTLRILVLQIHGRFDSVGQRPSDKVDTAKGVCHALAHIRGGLSGTWDGVSMSQGDGHTTHTDSALSELATFLVDMVQYITQVLESPSEYMSLVDLADCLYALACHIDLLATSAQALTSLARVILLCLYSNASGLDIDRQTMVSPILHCGSGSTEPVDSTFALLAVGLCMLPLVPADPFGCAAYERMCSQGIETNVCALMRESGRLILPIGMSPDLAVNQLRFISQVYTSLRHGNPSAPSLFCPRPNPNIHSRVVVEMAEKYEPLAVYISEYAARQFRRKDNPERMSVIPSAQCILPYHAVKKICVACARTDILRHAHQWVPEQIEGMATVGQAQLDYHSTQLANQIRDSMKSIVSVTRVCEDFTDRSASPETEGEADVEREREREAEINTRICSQTLPYVSGGLLGYLTAENSEQQQRVCAQFTAVARLAGREVTPPNNVNWVPIPVLNQDDIYATGLLAGQLCWDAHCMGKIAPNASKKNSIQNVEIRGLRRIIRMAFAQSNRTDLQAAFLKALYLAHTALTRLAKHKECVRLAEKDTGTDNCLTDELERVRETVRAASANSRDRERERGNKTTRTRARLAAETALFANEAGCRVLACCVLVQYLERSQYSTHTDHALTNTGADAFFGRIAPIIERSIVLSSPGDFLYLSGVRLAHDMTRTHIVNADVKSGDLEKTGGVRVYMNISAALGLVSKGSRSFESHSLFDPIHLLDLLQHCVTANPRSATLLGTMCLDPLFTWARNGIPKHHTSRPKLPYPAILPRLCTTAKSLLVDDPSLSNRALQMLRDSLAILDSTPSIHCSLCTLKRLNQVLSRADAAVELATALFPAGTDVVHMQLLMPTSPCPRPDTLKTVAELRRVLRTLSLGTQSGTVREAVSSVLSLLPEPPASMANAPEAHPRLRSLCALQPVGLPTLLYKPAEFARYLLDIWLMPQIEAQTGRESGYFTMFTVQQVLAMPMMGDSVLKGVSVLLQPYKKSKFVLHDSQTHSALCIPNLLDSDRLFEPIYSATTSGDVDMAGDAEREGDTDGEGDSVETDKAALYLTHLCMVVIRSLPDPTSGECELVAMSLLPLLIKDHILAAALLSWTVGHLLINAKGVVPKRTRGMRQIQQCRSLVLHTLRLMLTPTEGDRRHQMPRDMILTMSKHLADTWFKVDTRAVVNAMLCLNLAGDALHTIDMWTATDHAFATASQTPCPVSLLSNDGYASISQYGDLIHRALTQLGSDRRRDSLEMMCAELRESAGTAPIPQFALSLSPPAEGLDSPATTDMIDNLTKWGPEANSMKSGESQRERERETVTSESVMAQYTRGALDIMLQPETRRNAPLASLCQSLSRDLSLTVQRASMLGPQHPSYQSLTASVSTLSNCLEFAKAHQVTCSGDFSDGRHRLSRMSNDSGAPTPRVSGYFGATTPLAQGERERERDGRTVSMQSGTGVPLVHSLSVPEPTVPARTIALASIDHECGRYQQAVHRLNGAMSRLHIVSAQEDDPAPTEGETVVKQEHPVTAPIDVSAALSTLANKTYRNNLYARMCLKMAGLYQILGRTDIVSHAFNTAAAVPAVQPRISADISLQHAMFSSERVYAEMVEITNQVHACKQPKRRNQAVTFLGEACYRCMEHFCILVGKVRETHQFQPRLLPVAAPLMSSAWLKLANVAAEIEVLVDHLINSSRDTSNYDRDMAVLKRARDAIRACVSFGAVDDRNGGIAFHMHIDQPRASNGQQPTASHLELVAKAQEASRTLYQYVETMPARICLEILPHLVPLCMPQDATFNSTVPPALHMVRICLQAFTQQTVIQIARDIGDPDNGTQKNKLYELVLSAQQ
ncbi:hypothetical protein KIPB_000304, partial [Kipferlia bialata]|eukprot:g304.t1